MMRANGRVTVKMDAPFTMMGLREQGPLLGRQGLLLAMTLLWGCRGGDDPPRRTPEDRPQTAPSSAPASLAPKPPTSLKTEADDGPPLPPGVLAAEGPTQIRAEDLPGLVDEARALQIWIAGERPPEEALQTPELRFQILNQTLDAALVQAEATRRGLKVDDREVDALMLRAAAGLAPDDRPHAGRPPRPPIPTSQSVPERFLTSVAHVRHVALQMALADKVREALLAEMTPDKLRSLWLDDRTRLRLAYVQVGRVPSTHEIDLAVKTRGVEIRAWYDAHLDRFRQPLRRQIQRVVVAPVGQDAKSRDTARQKAEAARALVAAGTPPDGLPLEPGRRVMADRAVSRGQLPAAFDVPPGGLSPVMEDRDNFMFFRVGLDLPATERPFDDSTVQREIAATILRESDELPEAHAAAERLRGVLGSGDMGRLDAEIAALKVRVRASKSETPFFARSARDIVPGIGLAPELFKAAFALTKDHAVTTVIPVRQEYVVARLLEREDASPTDWPKAQAAYMARWRAREAPNVLRDWLTQQTAQRTGAAARRMDRRTVAQMPPEAWATKAAATGAPAPHPPQAGSAGSPPTGSPSGAPRP